MRLQKLVVILLGFVFFGVAAPASASVLGEAIRADSSATLSIDDVVRNGAKFIPAASFPAVTEGNVSRVYWLRTHVDAGSADGPWALFWSYKTTRVDLYVPLRNRMLHASAGFDLAAHDGAFMPGVLLVPQAALDGRTIYVRVATVVDPREVRLAPLAPRSSTSLQRRIVFGFFVGFFVAIGVFNLLMYVSLRDRALLNFAFVMLLSALRSAIAFGAVWQILPPISFLARELIYDTVALATGIVLALFSLDFLKLDGRERLARTFVAVGAAATLSVYLTDFFPNATVAFDWTAVVTLVYYAALLYAGIRAYRRGMRSAGVYAAGIICAAIGYAVNMSSYALPHQQLWVYALEAGEGLQAVLLAFAVAESVQESRAERERLLAESRQLEELAMRDGLTGVLNRRAFDAALNETLAAAAASGEPLGVLMVDIDFFKEYNDRFGHQAGDEALRAIARACGSCVRGGDVFARYGGEEFAAIVPGASDEELSTIAERMRASSLALGKLRGNGTPLTVSIGGCSARIRWDTTRDDLIRQADASLYVAKASGRDRIALGETVVLRP